MGICHANHTDATYNLAFLISSSTFESLAASASSFLLAFAFWAARVAAAFLLARPTNTDFSGSPG